MWLCLSNPWSGLTERIASMIHQNNTIGNVLTTGIAIGIDGRKEK
jgi:hypothetical protein